MKRPPLWLPVLVATAVYLPCAAGRAVLDVDEGLYVRAAQEMMIRGDWITPTVNGVRFLDKPPLLYWLLIGLYKLLGTGEFAAHVPPALAAVLTTWLVGRLARRSGDASAGLIAALSFALCCGTYLFTRETLHDGGMIFFQVLAVDALAGWLLEPDTATSSAAIFGVALAGGLLSKGLIGVLFPLGAALIAVVRLRPPVNTIRRVWISIVACAALAAPWHLLATSRNPGFLAHYFLNEQLLRFLNRREPADFDSIPVPIFLALVLVWMFPWTAFVAAAAPVFREQSPRGAIVRIASAWAALVLIFFSVSARLEHYAFSALPPLCVLAGVGLSPDATDPRRSRWVSHGFRLLAGIGVLLGLTAVATTIWLASRSWRLPFAGAGSTLQAAGTDFGPLSSLPPALMMSLLGPAIAVVGAFAVGFPVAAVLDARGRRLPAVAAVATTMVVFAAAAHLSLRVCEDVVSSKRFGVAVAARRGPGPTHVIVEGDYETANSMSFYQPWPIAIVDGQAPTLAAGLAASDAPHMVLTRAELEDLWTARGDTCVLAPSDRLASLRLGQATLVARAEGRALVCNDGGTR